MDIIMHSAKGSTWGKHKYIQKVRTRTGKWRYVYGTKSTGMASSVGQDMADKLYWMKKGKEPTKTIAMPKAGYDAEYNRAMARMLIDVTSEAATEAIGDAMIKLNAKKNNTLQSAAASGLSNVGSDAILKVLKTAAAKAKISSAKASTNGKTAKTRDELNDGVHGDIVLNKEASRKPKMKGK